ncbi:MAG: hypothetical protein LLF76_06425 [Planctomycetaceae bacterium]|nr:hypothetical protein [Planctomycetaceae bacterium]
MAKRTINPDSDIYTALLALACLAVVAATVFVAFKSMNYYGTDAIWKILQVR